MSKRNWLGLILAVLILSPAWFQGAAAATADRTGELSGEPATPKTQAPAAPGMQEPEARMPTKNLPARPALKMPDVVVKGERQFRVTAEKRELLMLDPMSGTKEIPSDLASVAIPGLNTQKGAPAADTVSAKNYLALLEAGGGTSRQGEGRVVVGQEFESINYLFQGNYLAGESSDGFGIAPFGQKGSAGLDVRATPLSNLNLLLSLLGQGESQRQPVAASAWGDWLERTNTGVGLQGEWAFASRSNLKVSGFYQNFEEQGAGASAVPLPQLDARIVEGKVEYEQNVGHVLNDGLSIWARLSLDKQDASLSRTPGAGEVSELKKTLEVVSRFRPATFLLLDAGVQLDDYSGVNAQSTAHVQARVSGILPTGSVLYAETHPGLRWRPVSDWAYEQPHPVVGLLPGPEEVNSDWHAGWRQNWVGVVSSDVAWFRQDAHATPVWMDANRDGLFEYVNLDTTRAQGVQAGLEVRYSGTLSQNANYTYRLADAGAEAHVPYVPQREFSTELRWSRTPWEISVGYHYLGERFSLPGSDAATLTPAHLLGSKADYEITRGWNVFARLDNMLGSTWEEWSGYPARTFAVLAGMRLSL